MHLCGVVDFVKDIVCRPQSNCTGECRSHIRVIGSAVRSVAPRTLVHSSSFGHLNRFHWTCIEYIPILLNDEGVLSAAHDMVMGARQREIWLAKPVVEESLACELTRPFD
jgi:hypothetical protein